MDLHLRRRQPVVSGAVQQLRPSRDRAGVFAERDRGAAHYAELPDDMAEGERQPYVSTLNSSTGAVTANAAVVPAGSGGDVSVFVYDDADVILDVNGYFAPPATGGLSLYTVTPCRVIDTRPDQFTGTIMVNVQGSTCAAPSTAEAYVLNATVVPRAR